MGWAWVLFAAFALLWLGFTLWQGWQQQKVRQRMLQDLAVGDEVITMGGIVGRVVEELPDRVLLESGPGTQLWVIKRAVGMRLEQGSLADIEEAEEEEQRRAA